MTETFDELCDWCNQHPTGVCETPAEQVGHGRLCWGCTLEVRRLDWWHHPNGETVEPHTVAAFVGSV